MARPKLILIGYLPRTSLQIAVGLFLLMLTSLTLVLARGEFLIWTTVPPGAIAGKVVVIDPGHGGIDPGCVGKSGIKEKEIVLPVAKYLSIELRKHNIRTILTREEDKSLAENGDPRLSWKRRDLGARVDIANQAQADLFISIHANSFPESIWSGAQTFYNGQSSDSKLLAESIQDSLVRALGPNRRRALAADYRVLRESKMPASVVEIGFLSNPREETLLSDPSYQRKAASAIASGIIAYFVAQYQAQRGRKPAERVSARLERTQEQMRRLRGGLAADQILLYFEGLDPNDDLLVPVVHKLSTSKEKLSTQELAQTIVRELIGGPKSDSVLYRTIPPETRLLGLSIAGDKAIVNFSREFITKHWGGSWSEELTIYSIVNSLTELPQIQRVQLLVEGESCVSIGGHVFLDQIFQRRDDVVLPVRAQEHQ
jgi:N-acetylmuramoyl-L-alanine amidase